MKIKKIILRLNQIEKIAKQQQRRLKDKNSHHKVLILRQSLDIIGVEFTKILEMIN